MPGAALSVLSHFNVRTWRGIAARNNFAAFYQTQTFVQICVSIQYKLYLQTTCIDHRALWVLKLISFTLSFLSKAIDQRVSHEYKAVSCAGLAM